MRCCNRARFGASGSSPLDECPPPRQARRQPVVPWGRRLEDHACSGARIGDGLVRRSYDLQIAVRLVVRPQEAAIIYLDDPSHEQLKQPFSAVGPFPTRAFSGTPDRRWSQGRRI